jgi:hypothetical protein
VAAGTAAVEPAGGGPRAAAAAPTRRRGRPGGPHPRLSTEVNYLTYLSKVVGNEKRGGSGSKLLIEYGFGLWQSMSVYYVMWSPSVLQSISVSCL